MAKKKVASYKVGYGRPPQGTRFRAGVSGNPAGRPKGGQNLGTIFSRILNERITIVEGGRKRSITKFEAALMQVVRLALSGNMPAMKHFLGLASLAERRAESSQSLEKPLNRTEARMLKSLTKQFQQMTEEPPL